MAREAGRDFFEKRICNNEFGARGAPRFFRKMDGTTPHLKFDYNKLADAWEKDSFPKPKVEEKVSVKKVTKKKKEEDGEDSWAKSYVDPVGETDAEKPLTRQELDALL